MYFLGSLHQFTLSLARHESHSAHIGRQLWLYNLCMFNEYNVFWDSFIFHSFDYWCVWLVHTLVSHSVIFLFPFPILLMFSRPICRSSFSIPDTTFLLFFRHRQYPSSQSVYFCLWYPLFKKNKFNIIYHLCFFVLKSSPYLSQKTIFPHWLLLARYIYY